MLKEVLQDLIRIDTRTSKFNETEAAEYLKCACDQHGIKCTIVEPVPGKGSFIAYIPGMDSSKKNLLLLSHLDTVEFGPLSEWHLHPLSATEYKGRIIGRGAIDCKGLVSICLSILIDIKKSGQIPERGIVFAAVADEESGGKYGMEYLIDHNEWIDNSEFVIGEGGGYPLRIGNTTYITCQNAEKGRVVYEIEESDDLQNIGNEIFTGSPWINLLTGLLKSRIFNRELFMFLIRQLLHNDKKRRLDPKVLLCDSYLIEKNESGYSLSFYQAPVSNLIRNKKFMKTDPVEEIPATFSKIDSELYKVITEETTRIMPQSRVIPYTTPGYSDNRFLRLRGKTVYGFFPLSFQENLSGIHGSNENISISGLNDAHHLLKNIVWSFTGLLRV